MEKDLKLIKKKYGEKMMHYCRSELSTILENDGLLPSLLLEHFNENHMLYDDIEKEGKLEEFKNYIYSLIDVENNNKKVEDKTPEELLSKAGYNFYECKTEEDIQSFKKYYSKGEELCTFRGGRLEKCYVFFAVKKNVDEIKRENFSKPKRQDEYGTSVISIQFTKESCALSIKNRYNSTVNNPDATFSNNLDNIIEGLAKSFENQYGFVQENNSAFELKNYVNVKGKYYKYNYEIDNVYYCLDNIIIDNFDVKKYDDERYIVFDYFVLDLKEKKILTEVGYDSFINGIVDIDKINIVKLENGKAIHIIPINREEIIIELDKQNRIVKYKNNNIKQCEGSFLYYNRSLQELNLPNLEQCGDDFLYDNESLQKLNLPNLEQCEYGFLKYNKSLQKLNLPNLEQCGDSFLCKNKSLQKLNLPSLERCGDSFLISNESLQELNLPSLERCEDSFLLSNESLQELNLPNLKQCGDGFLFSNQSLQKLNLPNLEQCGDSFLCKNKSLQKLNLPSLERCGDNFLFSNQSLQELNLPSLERCGDNFLFSNQSLQELNLPNLEKCGHCFLRNNESLQELNLPKK